MDPSYRREGMDISAFFGFMRRRGLIVLLALVVGAVAGYAISSGQAKQYSAKATVLLRGTTSTQSRQADDFSPAVPEAAQDREALVTADPVEQRARRRLARRLGSARAARLVNDVDVSSGQDSNSVDITAKAPAGRQAAAVANALATGTIANRRSTTLSRIKRAEKAAQQQLSQARGANSQSPAVTLVLQQVQQLRQQAATADGDADVTRRATAPASPSSPKPKRDAIIGGFAGLLIGFLLAMVREQLDRRLKHSKELEDVFGLPVLASVPRSRSLAVSNGKALEQLPPNAAESFQMLRANLRFLNTDKQLRSVVVTSPGVGDGKSTVSLNLAKADASVGQKVLLIEADMRRPMLAALLGMGPEPGLAAYLASTDLTLIEVAREVPVVHHTNGTGAPLTMDVVVAGSVPSNPSELVNSERMRDLVSEAEKDYDLVVIDTSPAGLVADAIPLMSQATAVVIVGRVGRVTGPEAGSLREQLERIDAPAFGLVANFTGSAEKAYGYY